MAKDNLLRDLWTGTFIVLVFISTAFTPVPLFAFIFFSLCIWTLSRPNLGVPYERRESQKSTEYKDNLLSLYGSNYYQWKVEYIVKGWSQSKKFVIASCVNEAEAIVKADPSVERILSICRV